ncbi:hypothetical protein P4J00_23790 [Bacillus cereus]|nr:hypothetical protein [Bacillus cereus]
MDIKITNDKVIIKVKTAFIPIDSIMYEKELKFLGDHIIEGEMNIQTNKFILKSNWESITFHLRPNEKERLRNLAKLKSITLEEVCREILLEKL